MLIPRLVCRVVRNGGPMHCLYHYIFADLLLLMTHHQGELNSAFAYFKDNYPLKAEFSLFSAFETLKFGLSIFDLYGNLYIYT